MKNFLFLSIMAVVAYKGWNHFQKQSVEPLRSEPYLVVYGRDTCGFTTRTINELTNAGINFEYMSVDDRSVADSLHSRMEAMGLSTRHYLLPVVDLNNSITIRPENGDLISRAMALSLSAAPSEIYKWVDADGRTHYSDSNDAAGDSRTKELKLNN